MIRPLLSLFGYRRLRAQREDAGRLINLCGQYGWVYRNLSFCGAHVCLDCSLSVAKKVKNACEARGIPLVMGEIRGLPGLFYRLRHRYGLAVGMIAFLLILFGSGQILWSIRVEGNEQMSDEEVIEELRECGFSVGDPITRLNTAILENRVLIASERISWISINMRGNVAHVVIREQTDPLPEENADAVNLVARRAGEIAWMEEVRGNIAVEIGDEIGAGELLVGGVYGKEGGPFRYTRASGRVIARTEHQFEIRIPLSYEKKEYTGEVKTEKYLIFFEKEVKFFGNTGNWSATCDTIDTVEYFGLSEEALLPVGIRTVRLAEYRTVSARRQADAAEELAYYRLRVQMESEVPDGTLIRKHLRTQLTDEELILWCDAEYLEDIAKPVKIEVEGAALPWRRNDTKNSTN